MKLSNYVLLLLIFTSCSTPPILENFDRADWIVDLDGCQSLRTEQVGSLLDQKEKILGLTDREVIELLGKPDDTNLYKRTQRFLVYYTSPGPNCDSTHLKPSRLEIRISALNTANEVIHYP